MTALVILHLMLEEILSLCKIYSFFCILYESETTTDICSIWTQCLSTQRIGNLVLTTFNVKPNLIFRCYYSKRILRTVLGGATTRASNAGWTTSHGLLIKVVCDS